MLLKYFTKTYKPIGIKTYCDKRYFSGKGYEAVGFVKSHDTPPQYHYVKGGLRQSRYLFQKHKLQSKLATFNQELSERDNMLNNGYLRIYDCGLSIYKLDTQKSPL